MRRAVLIFSVGLFLISAGSAVSAQETERKSGFKAFINSVDSILWKRRSTIKTDTDYVIRPQQAWTFKLTQNIKGDYIEFFSEESGKEDIDYYLKDQGSYSTGLSASYNGLTLSYAVNPKRLTGKTSSKEFGFNIFSRRYGVDFSSFDTKHYSGNMSGIKGTDEWENATMKGISIHGYYVFNDRKFSYPAAFTGSWIQRRSAGSFIAGATYFSSKYSSGVNQQQADAIIEKYHGAANHEDHIFILQESVNFKYFSLGVGYAYNFVPDSHWLIHASILPSLIPWRELESCNEPWLYNNELNDEQRQRLRAWYEENRRPEDPELSYEASSKFFNFANMTRLAITYSWKNCFAGLNAHFSTGFINCSTGGDTSFLSNTRWRVRCFFGLRL